jgi:hypothetical protein
MLNAVILSFCLLSLYYVILQCHYPACHFVVSLSCMSFCSVIILHAILQCHYPACHFADCLSADLSTFLVLRHVNSNLGNGLSNVNKVSHQNFSISFSNGNLNRTNNHWRRQLSQNERVPNEIIYL